MPSSMVEGGERLPASKQPTRISSTPERTTPKPTSRKRTHTPAPSSKLKQVAATRFSAQLMTPPDAIEPRPNTELDQTDGVYPATQLMTPPDTVGSIPRKNSIPLEEPSPEIKKEPKTRKISDVTYEDGTSIDEPEDPILRKQRKRRRNSDRPFRLTGSDDESDDEFVLKRHMKRRKNSDTIFKAPQTPTDSEDHNLGPVRKVKSQAQRHVSAQKRKSPAVKVKTEYHTPELSVNSLFHPDQRVKSPTSTIALASILTPAPTPAPTQISNKTQESRATSRKRKRDLSVHGQKRNSHHDSADGGSAVKVKRETSSSRSHTTRKPSIYTQADAIRDAAQDELDSDLQEPSPNKLKTPIVRYTNSRLEKARQRRQEMRSRKSGEMVKWSDGEIRLFDKLDMRGLDPQLPSSWKRDFTTMQPRVFGRNGEETFVRTLATGQRQPTGNFRASKAFRKLVDLGSYARDKTTLRQRPENVLRRGIKNYFRWSQVDARLDEAAYLDCLVVVKDDSGATPDPRKASAELARKMKKLAQHHRQAYYKERKVREWRSRSQELMQPPLTPLTPRTVATAPLSGWSDDDSSSIVSFDRPTEQPQQQPALSGLSWWQRIFTFFTPVGKKHAQQPAKSRAKGSQSNESSKRRLSGADVAMLDIDADAEAAQESPSDIGALYGILISHLVVQIVTLPIADPNAELHSILICDYNQASMDNWNALAVAVTICHAREDILKDAVPLIKSREEDDTDT